MNAKRMLGVMAAVVIILAAASANAGLLVSYWKLDEATGVNPVKDEQNAYNGTYYGTTQVSSTVPGSSYAHDFNGDQNCIVCSTTFPKPVSVSLWFDYDTADNYDGLFQYGLNTGDCKCSQLGFYGSKLEWWTRTSASDYRYCVIDTPPLTTWNHVVLVWDGTKKEAYVNGKLSTMTIGGGGSDTDSANLAASDVFEIGRMADTGYYYYDGKIDEVRVYDYALTAGEVGQLFNPTAVPEPAGLGLVGMALLALRRRRSF